MSKGAAKLLFNLGVDSFKVGSGDVTDFRLISYLCDLGFPIMISTGMVSYSELSKVSEYILSRNVNLTIMYCISEYPCSESRFNMSSITRIKELFPEPDLPSSMDIQLLLIFNNSKLGGIVVTTNSSVSS